METKKHPKKNLELNKSLFFQIGLVFALILVLLAFEWKKYGSVDLPNDIVFTTIDIPEQIEITKPEPKPEPPVLKETKIVDNNEEVDEVIEIPEFEGYANTETYITKPIEIEDEVHHELLIRTISEIMPSFPGGEKNLFEFIAKNIKYPDLAKRVEISGTVYVRFIVEPDGSISNIELLRGIGGGCDEEAIRVMQSMPRWSPGIQEGKAVRVSLNQPIKFVLM